MLRSTCQYTSICLIIQSVFLFLNFYKIVYWLTPLNVIYRTHWLICVRNCQWWPLETVKLPMTAVQNSHISNTRWLFSFENIVQMFFSCNWNRLLMTYYIYISIHICLVPHFWGQSLDTNPDFVQYSYFAAP